VLLVWLAAALPAAAQPFVYRTAVVTSDAGSTLHLHVTNVVNGSDTSIPIGAYSGPALSSSAPFLGGGLIGPQVVISPDNTTAWVTGGDVFRVALASGTVTPLGLGTAFAAVALSPDGSRLYVGDRDCARVVVVDTATGLVTGGPIVLTHVPNRLVISPDGSQVYVLADGASQRMFVASTTTRAVTLTITPTHYPMEIVLTPDATRVFAIGYSHLTGVSTPDGTSTGDYIVTAYDTISGAMVSTMSLAHLQAVSTGLVTNRASVHRPAMSGDGTKLYVPAVQRSCSPMCSYVPTVSVVDWPAMTLRAWNSVPATSPQYQYGAEIGAVAAGGDSRLFLGGANGVATINTTTDAVAAAGPGVSNTTWVAAGGASAGAPAIVTHPLSQTVDAGTTVTVTVAATSDAALSYQWQYSTDGGTTWANVPANSGYTGMTTATLTIAPARTSRQYRVRVSNHLGTATSTAATITVMPGGGWQPVATSGPSEVRSLTVLPDGTLIAASKDDRVWRQSAAGQPFTSFALPTGLPAMVGDGPDQELLFHGGNNEVFYVRNAGAGTDPTMYRGFRSRDGGQTFAAWDTLANVDGPAEVLGTADGSQAFVVFWAGSARRLYRVSGLTSTTPTFQPADVPPAYSPWGLVTTGSTFWSNGSLSGGACTRPMYQFDLTAMAFTPSTICPAGLYANSVATNFAVSSDGLTLYAVGQTGFIPATYEVLRSTDGGATWALRGTVPAFTTSVTVHPQQASWVYAATINGLYRSKDGGTTWAAVGQLGGVVQMAWRGTTLIVATETSGLWALDASPELTATPSSLRFGARKSGASGPLTAVTPAQTVTVTSAGGSAAWTATSDQSWLTITGGSGTGSGTFTVAVVDPSNLIGSSTSLTATITLSSTTPGVTSVTIPVTLTVDQSGVSTTAPFGVVDTPSHGATGLVGAIAMTGWALDDIGVQRVEVWRNCVGMDFAAGVCTSPQRDGGMSHVYIGQAAFLPGARPDVEQAYATLPQARRGGWGFLLLTNGLPHLPNNTPQGGQGTFVLSAFAFDQEGQLSLLGAKEVTVANDAADVPFGNLDTPSQGAILPEASFPFNEPAAYPVFGWAMTQSGKCIVTSDPTRYRVLVNGVPQSLVPGVNWFSGLSRSDLAAAFPGRCNSNDALAAYYLDLRPLGNGLHTLAWEVTDSAGKVAGIGSRFFEVLLPTTDAPLVGQGFSPATRTNVGQGTNVGQVTLVGQGFSPATTPLMAQVGTSDAAWTTLTPSADGVYDVRVPLQGRVVLDVGGAVSAAAEIVGDERRALPTGSTLEAGAGRFYWQPPVGFVGTYTLRFTTAQGELTVRVTWYEPR
jgi:hypothetical protein